MTTISKSDFYRLRELKLERSEAVPQGRIMFCRGRKIVAIRELANFGIIPSAANTVCLSPADYAVIAGDGKGVAP